jgi:hypothetical protein
MSPKGRPSSQSRISAIASLSFLSGPLLPRTVVGQRHRLARSHPPSYSRSDEPEKDCCYAPEGRVSCGAGRIRVFSRSGYHRRYSRDPKTADPAVPGSKCGGSDGAQRDNEAHADEPRNGTVKNGGFRPPIP